MVNNIRNMQFVECVPDVREISQVGLVLVVVVNMLVSGSWSEIGVFRCQPLALQLMTCPWS